MNSSAGFAFPAIHLSFDAFAQRVRMELRVLGIVSPPNSVNACPSRDCFLKHA